MAYVAPGTKVAPADVNVNTQYDSEVGDSPDISVFKFDGVAGKKYEIGVEVNSTEPLFTLSNSELYIYKPSNLNYTDSTYDYYNANDYGPWDLLPPYPYSLGAGSRYTFTATETGLYVVIIVKYGTGF